MALTGRFALKRSPVACETMSEGIVMVASVPPMMTGSPATLFATMAAMAPAFCAFFTLTTKSHEPRSRSAI